MSKEKKITIIEIDDKRQQIDTKLTDAREVLRILSTTIGGFVVELSQQNPDQQKQLKDAVLDTIGNIIDAGIQAKPIQMN
jgi:hypothetical protein